MTHARTIWEEGREPGRRVVALGIALVLTCGALDLAINDHVDLVFDLVFVAVSLTLALMVHPRDFFTVGVLPPLLMLGLFVLLALTRPEAIASPDDGVVQAVVTGLGRHSVALFAGYAACLGALALRRRVLARAVRRAASYGHGREMTRSA